MSYVVLVSTLLLIQYTFFSMRAGIARGKADIKAPATSGDEHFEPVSYTHLTLPTIYSV